MRVFGLVVSPVTVVLGATVVGLGATLTVLLNVSVSKLAVAGDGHAASSSNVRSIEAPTSDPRTDTSQSPTTKASVPVPTVAAAPLPSPAPSLPIAEPGRDEPTHDTRANPIERVTIAPQPVTSVPLVKRVDRSPTTPDAPAQPTRMPPAQSQPIPTSPAQPKPTQSPVAPPERPSTASSGHGDAEPTVVPPTIATPPVLLPGRGEASPTLPSNIPAIPALFPPVVTPPATPGPSAPPVATSPPIEPTPPTVQAAGVGVPPGTRLTRHDGTLYVTTPGAVIDSLEVYGAVIIQANNVTIKNSRIHGAANPSTPAASIDNNRGFTGLLVSQSDVTGTTNDWRAAMGIAGHDMRIERTNIYGVVDNVTITGNNVIIDNSWLHGNLYVVVPNRPAKDRYAHADNVQIQQGNNIQILNSRLEDSTNAATMITQDDGKVDNVTWRNNYINGGACSINIAEKRHGRIKGLILSNNTFGNDTANPNCAVIAPGSSAPGMDRNHWADTDREVQVSRG